jgi:hypothetical protein
MESTRAHKNRIFFFFDCTVWDVPEQAQEYASKFFLPSAWLSYRWCSICVLIPDSTLLKLN